MPLDPRAIATQGLGFAELLVAVQGLLPLAAEADDTPSDPFAAFRPRRRVRRWFPPLQDDLTDDELVALLVLGRL